MEKRSITQKAPLREATLQCSKISTRMSSDPIVEIVKFGIVNAIIFQPRQGATSSLELSTFDEVIMETDRIDRLQVDVVSSQGLCSHFLPLQRSQSTNKYADLTNITLFIKPTAQV